MGAEDDFVAVGNAAADGSEELANLVGRGVPDGIGQVDRRGPGLDHGLDDPAQELEIAARGVLGRELDVRRMLPGETDGVDRGFQALVPRHGDPPAQRLLGVDL